MFSMLKILVLALVLSVVVAGCVGQSSIGSKDEAAKTIQDVGTGVENVGSGLQPVEEGLTK